MSKLPEGHRLGPYRVVRLMGAGGMGATYAARQEFLGRQVAAKTGLILHSVNVRAAWRAVARAAQGGQVWL